MNFTVYLLFSTLEGIALFCIMLTLYRYNFRYYFTPVLLASIIRSILSYLLRVEWNLKYIDPIVTLVVITCSIVWMLEINVFWAIIVSLSGFMSFVAIQVSILLLFDVFNWTITDTLHTVYDLGLMLLSSLTCGFIFVLSGILYRRGWGFAFSFHKLNKAKDIMTLSVLISCSLLALVIAILSLIQGFNKALLFAVLFFSSLSSLLYYALLKERRND